MTEDLKHPITIAIRRPSKTPSVFVAASFADPAWEPVELNPELLSSKDTSTTDDSSTQVEEYEFSMKFDLPEGKHQYRFRLGTDESSWFCDKDVDTVVDEDGVENNIIVVNHTAPTASEINDSKITNGTSTDNASKESAEEEKKEETVEEEAPAMAVVVGKSDDKEAPVDEVDKATPEEEKKPDDAVDVPKDLQEMEPPTSKDEVKASSDDTKEDTKDEASEEKGEDKGVKVEDTLETSEETVPIDTTDVKQDAAVPELVKGPTVDESEVVIDAKPIPVVSPEVADIPKTADDEVEAQQVTEPVTTAQSEDVVPESTAEAPEESKEPEPQVEATEADPDSKELPEKEDVVETSDPVVVAEEDTTDNVETPLVAESEVITEEPKKDVPEAAVVPGSVEEPA
ncbi:hypothetical protein FQN49_008637, partial [Arthroderma sp. PD_2]